MHLLGGVRWPWQEQAGVVSSACISELLKAELVFSVRNIIPSAL